MVSMEFQFDSERGCMKDEDLQPLFRKWAAKKLGVKPSAIREVDFGTIYGGYCETCAYETFGAHVTLTSGKKTEIEEYEATDVIRELLELHS